MTSRADLSNTIEEVRRLRDYWRDRYHEMWREVERLNAELDKWRAGNLRDGKHDCSACGEAVEHIPTVEGDMAYRYRCGHAEADSTFLMEGVNQMHTEGE